MSFAQFLDLSLIETSGYIQRRHVITCKKFIQIRSQQTILIILACVGQFLQSVNARLFCRFSRESTYCRLELGCHGFNRAFEHLGQICSIEQTLGLAGYLRGQVGQRDKG